MNVIVRLSALFFTLLATAAVSVAATPWLTGFSAPVGIAEADDGTLYVTNWSGNTVERIMPDGARSVFTTKVSSPAGIAVGPGGEVFVASYSGDTVWRFDSPGEGHVLADGLATPAGLFLSGDGKTLLVANRASGEVVAIDIPTGAKRTVEDGFDLPVGVVRTPDGSLVVSQYGGWITRVNRHGERTEIGSAFDTPGVGLIADGPGAVIAVDVGDGVVRRVDFQGEAKTLIDDISGNPVALRRAGDGSLLVGTWGSGFLYRIQP